MLPFRNWTYPVGPWLAVILNSFLVLVQGWRSFSPRFNAVDFVSFYLELPVMLAMFLGWKFYHGTRLVHLDRMDLETDVHVAGSDDDAVSEGDEERKKKKKKVEAEGVRWRVFAKRIISWVA